MLLLFLKFQINSANENTINSHGDTYTQLYFCIVVSRMYEYFDFICAVIYLFLICISLSLSISPAPLFCRLATFSSLLRPVSAVNSFCFLLPFAYANRPSFDFFEPLFVCAKSLSDPVNFPSQFETFDPEMAVFASLSSTSYFHLSTILLIPNSRILLILFLTIMFWFFLPELPV